MIAVLYERGYKMFGKRLIAAVSLILLVMFTGCGKYPRIVEEKTIHATVEELIYEKERDYRFAVVSTEGTEDRLTFRISQNFYEQAKVGQTMDITYKKCQYLNAVTKSKYYWNGSELDNCFIRKSGGDTQAVITDAEYQYRHEAGRHHHYYYITFRDTQGREKTVNVGSDLYNRLYIGETVYLDRKEPMIKDGSCSYYLDGQFLFSA